MAGELEFERTLCVAKTKTAATGTAIPHRSVPDTQNVDNNVLNAIRTFSCGPW